MHRKDSTHESCCHSHTGPVPGRQSHPRAGGRALLRQPPKPNEPRHFSPGASARRRKGGVPIKALTAPRAALSGGAPSPRSKGEYASASSSKLLEQHTRDMGLEAARGTYDPVAGREEGLDRVIREYLQSVTLADLLRRETA